MKKGGNDCLRMENMEEIEVIFHKYMDMIISSILDYYVRKN